MHDGTKNQIVHFCVTTFLCADRKSIGIWTMNGVYLIIQNAFLIESDFDDFDFAWIKKPMHSNDVNKLWLTFSIQFWCLVSMGFEFSVIIMTSFNRKASLDSICCVCFDFAMELIYTDLANWNQRVHWIVQLNDFHYVYFSINFFSVAEGISSAFFVSISTIFNLFHFHMANAIRFVIFNSKLSIDFVCFFRRC